jgi:hypothetical protein
MQVLVVPLLTVAVAVVVVLVKELAALLVQVVHIQFLD